MLRPYTVTPPDQFLTRQPFRFFDVRLVECVDAETLAERLGRVLPAQELAAEVERVRGELRWSGRLKIRQRRIERIVDDRHDTAAVLPRAFGDQLLDPMSQCADLARRREPQFVTPRLGAIGDRAAESFRRGDVQSSRPLEQRATVQTHKSGGPDAPGRHCPGAPTHAPPSPTSGASTRAPP